MDLQNLQQLRRGAAGCPSDLDLDLLAGDELPAPTAATLTAHVAGCRECGARMQERKAGFAALADVDARPLLAAIRRRVDAEEEARARRAFWRRPLAWLAAPLAAAAAFALFMTAHRDGPHEGPGLIPESGVREKGGLSLQVVRLVGDHTERPLSGDAFHAGDRLRFIVDLPSAGHINVLGSEATGGMYVGWPTQEGGATLRSAGKRQELPGAVVLDSSVGRETIYLAFCPAAVGVPAVVCHAGAVGAPPSCPDGCALTPFVLDKK